MSKLFNTMEKLYGDDFSILLVVLAGTTLLVGYSILAVLFPCILLFIPMILLGFFGYAYLEMKREQNKKEE